MKKCVSRGRAAPPSDTYREWRGVSLLFPTQKTLSEKTESVFAITG